MKTLRDVLEQCLLILLWWALALVLFFWRVLGHAAAPDAVVRLPSHGGSGTVVWTGPGRTLILSCGHCFQGQDRYKGIVIDAPSPSPGAVVRPGIKLLKVDYSADLSLMELNAGPLPYVCPIAEPGHRPGRLVSAGFDEMVWHQSDTHRATVRTATLLGSRGSITYTQEAPWHGRSGGALIDADAGKLIGVVSGYEVGGTRRGLYVSHTAILRFVGWDCAPQVSERRVGPTPRLDADGWDGSLRAVPGPGL